MNICVIQARSATGRVEDNIAHHLKLLAPALARGAEMIIFPELSLTAYEPGLANALAINYDDNSLDVFQELADSRGVSIGVGMPTQATSGVSISMLLFRAGQQRLCYSKQYLHADEEPYFVPGKNLAPLSFGEHKIALAVCYEISVPEHAAAAAAGGASLYVASVAKSVKGIEKAHECLSQIAARYAMPVLMANCIGEADGMQCAGRSAAWDAKGQLLNQLDGQSEGMLLFNTEKGSAVAYVF